MINNDFYETLKDDWYDANNHPIALLRAENRCRAPWVAKILKTRLGSNLRVLDIGCGAGFLSNDLSKQGNQITGIDLSESSLQVAQKHDATKKVTYIKGDAYNLPFVENAFDAVCAMDILEHVEKPAVLIHEASRVLRPGGLFFFHTFNRNWLSHLIVIKGVDWFVKNAPKNMHVYDLFITPQELTQLCAAESLTVDTCVGLVPQITKWAFWKMLLTREVPADFAFTFTKSLATGYCGVAVKKM